VVKDAPQPLYTPGKNHGTHCRGARREFRVGLEGDGDPPTQKKNPADPAGVRTVTGQPIASRYAGPQPVMWVCQYLVYKTTQADGEPIG